MPDDTIVNLEELAQNLDADFTAHLGELENIDISSLSAEELETYSALLTKYALQIDPNIMDSLMAKVDERINALSAQINNAQEEFYPQKFLEEWQAAKDSGDEDKMNEIGEQFVQVLPELPKNTSTASIEDVYALHNLLTDDAFMNHIPMKTRYDAFNFQGNLYWGRIVPFENQYGLYPLQDPATVQASHETLDAISTKDLLQDLDEETKEILNRLTVVTPFTKPLKTTLKYLLDSDQPDNDIALMIERVRLEAQIAVANRTAPEKDIKEAFAEEFKDRLQYNVTVLTLTDETRAIFDKEKRNLTKDEAYEIYKHLAKSIDPEIPDPIIVNQSTLASWHAQRQADSEVALKHMDKHGGFSDIVTNLRVRLEDLDDKCHKKYGNLYSLAKTALKSAGWGAAYSVGATFGPIGITAVATASFANNAYKQYREFKKAKEKDPELKSFWGYLRKNKTATASLGLGLVSAATAAVGLSGDSLVKTTKIAAGASLGLSGAFKASAKAFKETEGSRYDKTKAALKSFGSSAAGFIVGMWAGQAAGSAINTDTHIPEGNNLADVSEQIHEAPANEVPVNEAPVTEDEAPANNAPANEAAEDEAPANNAPANEAAEDEAPTNNAPANEAATAEAPANNAPANEAATAEAPANEAATAEAPAIDLDNLTPQQQHDLDMLFKRAPTEAHEVLGKAGYEGGWMNSRELAEAYDNLTDAQKTALVQYAGERFDDAGNFQNVEGHSKAAQMEAEAKEYSQAHHAEQNKSEESQEQNHHKEQVVDDAVAARDVHVTKDGTRYSFDENGININGSTKDIDVKSLCPENNGDTASKVLEAHLKTVALQDRAYMDLAARELAGEQFNAQERVFINHHEQLLDRFGLTHDGDGKLVRASTPETNSNTSQEVDRVRSMLYPEQKTETPDVTTRATSPIQIDRGGR